MASAAQQREIFARLLREHGRKIAIAFAMAVSNSANGASIPNLSSAIEAGDITRIAEIMRLDKSGMYPVTEAIRAAFTAGGMSAAEMVASRAVWGFDGSNARAEAWVVLRSGTLVQGIEADTLAMLRHVIADAVSRGVSADKVARSIVGRTEDGKRIGGFIGLTAEQAEYALRAREQLEELDQGYFRRELRDRRFDAAVRKAMADGKPISEGQISRIVSGYREKMLGYRGRNIARNEAHTALAAAQYEGFRQLIEAGRIETVTKRWQWNDGGQKEPRLLHQAMSQAPARSFEMGFSFPDGVSMQYPHDPAGGAKHSMNCFAPWMKISRLGLKKAFKRQYSGDLVELSFGGNMNLAVTPNHPILTRRGWIAAGEITKGEYLFDCRVGYGGILGSDRDVEDVQAAAHEIYDSAEALGCAYRVSGGVVNFHGDISDENVDIVSIDGGLGAALDTAYQECVDNVLFADADEAGGRLIAERLLDLCSRIDAHRSDSLVRRFGAVKPLLGGHHGASPAVSVGAIGPGDAKVGKASINKSASDAKPIGYGEHCVAFADQALDLIVQLFSLGEGVCASGGTLAAAPAPIRGWDAEIGKARSDDRNGESGFSGYLGNAFSGLRGLLNGRKKRLSLRLSPRGLRGTVAKIGGTLPFAEIASVRVNGVKRFHYSGPVYNFESASNVLIANGIVNHNCRCVAIYRPVVRA